MNTDKNEVTTTKERVIKASETCPDAKGVLKELFPEVFKGDWVNISNDIELRKDSFGNAEGFFVELWWASQHIGYMSPNVEKEPVTFYKEYLQDCKTHHFKCEGDNDVFKIYAKRT